MYLGFSAMSPSPASWVSCLGKILQLRIRFILCGNLECLKIIFSQRWIQKEGISIVNLCHDHMFTTEKFANCFNIGNK